MRVRGMGRRSARPPYNILWATLAAAETIWSGLGIRSMRRSYQPARSRRQRSRPVSYVQAAFEPLAGPAGGAPDLLGWVVEEVEQGVEVLGGAARTEGTRGRGPHPRQVVRGQPCRGVAAGELPPGRHLEAHLGHPPGLVNEPVEHHRRAGVVPHVEQSAGTPDPGPVRLPGPAAVQHVPATRAAEEEHGLRVVVRVVVAEHLRAEYGGAARADVRLEEAEQLTR